MGDKPEPIPYVDGCFLTICPDNKEPSTLTMTVSGIKKGASWAEWIGEPLEGTFIVPHTACARWSLEVGDVTIMIRIDIFDVGIEIWRAVGAIPQYLWYGEFEDLIGGPGQDTGPSDPFYSGEAFIETNKPGQGFPASWSAADLIVVPKTTGYFAEQGYTGLDAKHFRYCNESNNTNIKIILD